MYIIFNNLQQWWNIFAGKINLNVGDEDQSDLLSEFVKFNKNAKLRDVKKTKNRRNNY